MTVWRSPAEVPADLGRTVVTIGVFDGVHRGHQAVLERAAKHARGADIPLVAVTFDPNPMVVIRPDAAPLALLSVAHRSELLHDAGANHVFVLQFDRDRAQQPAEGFVDDVLIGLLGVQVLVVGADFRFGHRAAGDVDLLQRLAPTHDFIVETVDMAGGDGVPRWSSTYIRERVVDGEVAAAAAALGRPVRIEGVVGRGAGRGRALGFPTANIPAPDDQAVPADGVYAGWLIRLDDTEELPLPAAISVGTNPTFGDARRTVEPYVLDRHDLDLYDVPVAVDFVEWIRHQQHFDSADDLVAQMHEDVAAARTLLDS